MLELDRVSVTLESERAGSTHVLDNVSLRVDKGEFAVICGPSGCGKSTLLRLIAGLLKQQAGRITVNGRPIQGPSPQRGIVFQSYNSFPWLTVRRNIEFSISSSVRDRVKRDRIIDHQLEIMGLEGFEDYYPGALSGGMRQRVALARTLAMNPLILLLDEAFGALDAMTRYALQLHVQERAVENGWTVLLVTHDVDSAILLGDRVLVLSRRPARVVREESIPFARPRTAAIRDHPSYRGIRAKLVASIETSDSETVDGRTPSPPADFHQNRRKSFSWSRVLRDSS